MKRIIVLMGWVLVVCCLTGPVAAESTAIYGLKLGLNISSWDIDAESVDLDARKTLAGGATAQVPLSGPWSLQAEFLYVPKGAIDKVMAVDESGEPAGEVTANFQANYIEVPVLIRVDPGGGRFFLLGGPVVDLLASTKYKQEGAAEETLDYVKGIDFGLVAGLGVGLPTDFGSVVIEGRYIHGLSDINDEDEGWAIKNRAFLVTAGVTF